MKRKDNIFSKIYYTSIMMDRVKIFILLGGWFVGVGNVYCGVDLTDEEKKARDEGRLIIATFKITEDNILSLDYGDLGRSSPDKEDKSLPVHNISEIVYRQLNDDGVTFAAGFGTISGSYNDGMRLSTGAALPRSSYKFYFVVKDALSSMNYFFANAKFLIEVDFSFFNTSKITSMSSLFSGCPNLKSISWGNFNTQNVTSMANMFRNCSSLTSLDLRSFNTQNVTNMTGLLCGCSLLESVTWNSFVRDKVTTLNGMFGECFSLTSVDLSNCNARSVISCNGIFRGCTALTSVNFSNSVFYNVESLNFLFEGCISLTSVNFNNADFRGVNSLFHLFCGCTSLESVNLEFLGGLELTNINGLFKNCESLITVAFGRNFNTSNVQNMDEMFFSCKSLPFLDLSMFDSSNVFSMVRMFSGCEVLKHIRFGNRWSMGKVKDASEMFKDCESLSVLACPQNFSPPAANCNYKDSFAGCKNLINEVGLKERSVDVVNERDLLNVFWYNRPSRWGYCC